MFNYTSWESFSDFGFDMLLVLIFSVGIFALAVLVNRHDRETRRYQELAGMQHTTGGPDNPEPGPLPPTPPAPAPQPGPGPPPPGSPRPTPPDLPLPGKLPGPRNESI